MNGFEEVAHQMGLVPLVWLLLRRERSRAYWWLAAVFGVSWLADTGVHWLSPWVVMLVYPVSQAGLVAAVFRSRREAAVLVAVLALVGTVTLGFWAGTPQPDAMLRTLAWVSIVAIVGPLKGIGLLRTALLMTFGAGLLVWLVVVATQSYGVWMAYQSVRLAGILLFCAATVRARPALRLLVTRATP